MNVQEIRQSTFVNFFDGSASKNIRASFKSMLVDELKSSGTFADSWQDILEKYFGQSSQIYFHVTDAANISQEVWTHNDFPYEKFLADSFDESVLSWQPTRANPSQLNPQVQSKLTATLGKHAIVIPPELKEKMEVDPALRKKVLANVDRIYKFHMQPPAFRMPGVKEYGTKIFGSVTILNAEGDVKNCVVTSGGTITGPDEETLRQIEAERKRKLQRKEFNTELLEEIQIRRWLKRDYNLMSMT